MSWFSSAFKAVGQAASFVGGKVLKPALTVLKPALQVAASFLPVAGPLAGALVGKLLPDAPEPVQVQALETIAQAAAAPAVAPDAAIAQAAQFKQTLLGLGVQSQAASSLGAVLKVAAEAPAGQAPAVLNQVNAALPAVPLAQGFTKEDIKVIVKGAIEGAKNGAADAYLDGTADGKATKSAAIETQGQKIIPYVALGLLAFIFLKRK